MSRSRLGAGLCGVLPAGCAVFPVPQPPAATLDPFATPGPLYPSGFCSVGVATPTPMPVSTVSAADLSGDWLPVLGAEPAPGPVGSCQYLARIVVRIRRTPDGVAMWPVLVGIHPGYFSDDNEAFSPTYRDGELRATSSQAGPDGALVTNTYVLRFDAARQQLVGTRNEQRLWLIPIVQQNGPCDPQPPVSCPPLPGSGPQPPSPPSR